VGTYRIAWLMMPALRVQVLAMEAEAESTALLVGNDKLENKFLALETGSGR
jgi:hypothetical protein